jgi:hypothetical protein
VEVEEEVGTAVEGLSALVEEAEIVVAAFEEVGVAAGVVAVVGQLIFESSGM